MYLYSQWTSNCICLDNIEIEKVNRDMKKRFFVIVLMFTVALFLINPGTLYNVARQKGYKALKVIAYYNNTKPENGSNTYETGHFIINGKNVDIDEIEEFGALLEKSYYLIGNEFDYYPDKKTPVRIYGTMDDFWSQNKSLDGQAVMGLYHLGVIHLVVPEVFNMELNEYERNGPILHEYTHKVADDISNGNIEIWFTEGLALYQEYLNYDAAWGDGLVFEKEYTREELSNKFLSLDPVQAYKQSFETVKDIYEKEGKEKVIELIKELGNGTGMDDAMEKIDLKLGF